MAKNETLIKPDFATGAMVCIAPDLEGPDEIWEVHSSTQTFTKVKVGKTTKTIANWKLILAF